MFMQKIRPAGASEEPGELFTLYITFFSAWSIIRHTLHQTLMVIAYVHTRNMGTKLHKYDVHIRTNSTVMYVYVELEEDWYHSDDPINAGISFYVKVYCT